MELKGTLQKPAEVMYLKAYKQETRYRTKNETNHKQGMLNIFTGFEVTKIVRLWLGKQKDSMKRKCYVFPEYEQRNKMSFLYLQCKLHQDSYG